MEAFLLSWVKRFLEMHEASISKNLENGLEPANNEEVI